MLDFFYLFSDNAFLENVSFSDLGKCLEKLPFHSEKPVTSPCLVRYNNFSSVYAISGVLKQIIADI